jgi:aerobic-type carbon monoxide dehydrogenase small subunit (CoxS/CutS family)
VSYCSKDGRTTISLEVDGKRVKAAVSPRLLLSDFLRGPCAAKGVHVGCEHGVCGACTVRVDGQAVRACLMLAIQTDGSRVETVKVLGIADAMHPLQERFQARHALQCGFCTPGILISAQTYLREHPAPTRRDIEELLSGHLCRCTGYTPIVDAILDAAELERR